MARFLAPALLTEIMARFLAPALLTEIMARFLAPALLTEIMARFLAPALLTEIMARFLTIVQPVNAKRNPSAVRHVLSGGPRSPGARFGPKATLERLVQRLSVDMPHK